MNRARAVEQRTEPAELAASPEIWSLTLFVPGKQRRPALSQPAHCGSDRLQTAWYRSTVTCDRSSGRNIVDWRQRRPES